MTSIAISGNEGQFFGFYHAPEPFVVMLDDDGPETPHRLIFQNLELLTGFLTIAQGIGAGFPDSQYILEPDNAVPVYLRERVRNTFKKLDPKTDSQIKLRPYKYKNIMLTGHMEGNTYLYLLGMMEAI